MTGQALVRKVVKPESIVWVPSSLQAPEPIQPSLILTVDFLQPLFRDPGTVNAGMRRGIPGRVRAHKLDNVVARPARGAVRPEAGGGRQLAPGDSGAGRVGDGREASEGFCVDVGSRVGKRVLRIRAGG